VLGFSKGFTQADAYRIGRFEEIPFKDMRPRLAEVLRLLGVIGPTEFVDQKMVATETDLAFGSLIRCSLSRRNDKTGKYECTGQVMPKAFSEDVSTVVRQCASRFLLHLPDSVRLVLMLESRIATSRDAEMLSARSTREASRISMRLPHWTGGLGPREPSV